MSKKQTRLLNKLKLMVRLECWDQLNKKYRDYLDGTYSCRHCKFNKLKDRCGMHLKQIQASGGWCFVWLDNFKEI